MEGLVLHHLPVVLEKVHGQFKVVAAGDVRGHDDIVGSVEEKFAEQFDGLPFCDVRGAQEEDGIVVFGEEEIVVRREVLRDEILMLGQEFSKRRERVGADLEAALVDPLEEGPEDACTGLFLADVNGGQLDCFFARLALVVEDDGGDGVVGEGLSQDGAAGHGALLVFVTAT